MAGRGRSVPPNIAQAVETLINEGKTPVEIRRLTNASLPYIYRQFRRLDIPTPMEQAGYIRSLTLEQKQYIQENIEDGAEALSADLGANLHVVKGYLLDLAIESLLAEVSEVDVIADRLQISPQRVRIGLARLGYEAELKWIKLAKPEEVII